VTHLDRPLGEDAPDFLDQGAEDVPEADFPEQMVEQAGIPAAVAAAAIRLPRPIALRAVGCPATNI
jgi:hypothetical protein